MIRLRPLLLEIKKKVVVSADGTKLNCNGNRYKFNYIILIIVFIGLVIVKEEVVRLSRNCKALWCRYRDAS